MTVYLLTAILVAAGLAYAVWPLVRHQPAPSVASAPAPPPDELDELRLDVDSGRLSAAEAAALLRELERK